MPRRETDEDNHPAAHEALVAAASAIQMTAAAFKLTMPVPAERDVHENCARVLDALLLPPAMWFTYPAGAAQLSPQQQARFSRIGLKRGLPDLWFLHQGVYLIELKRPGSPLSKTRIVHTKRGAPRELLGQDKQFPRLLASGAVTAISVCYTVDEVLAQLTAWGIPMRGRVAA